jgi:hypothetical protein
MFCHKAGSMPHRAHPVPAATTPDDEMEMSDLIIDVKPEPDMQFLQAQGLGHLSSKDKSVPERFRG